MTSVAAIRNMLAYLAIGSSGALGCAFEMAPEPDTALEVPIVGDQSVLSVQVAPDVATTWPKDGYALIRQAETGHFGASDRAKEVLLGCLDKSPNIADCVRLVGIASRPRPGCGFACNATTPSPPIHPNGSTLPTLPATP